MKNIIARKPVLALALVLSGVVFAARANAQGFTYGGSYPIPYGLGPAGSYSYGTGYSGYSGYAGNYAYPNYDYATPFHRPYDGWYAPHYGHGTYGTSFFGYGRGYGSYGPHNGYGGHGGR